MCDCLPQRKHHVSFQNGCGSVEYKETPVLFSSETNSCFQGVFIPALGSQLVNVWGQKSENTSVCTKVCIYILLWIHMPFCFKNKYLQDYEYIYPTAFPPLFSVALIIFVCVYIVKFIFYCCSKLYILDLLQEKERKWTSSFPPIEAKEQSDTCLTYFLYPCKSNAAAPSNWVSKMHRLIYTDVKRGKIFAQLKRF